MAASLVATGRLPSKTSATRRALVDTSSSISKTLADTRALNHHRDSSRHQESFPVVEDWRSPADAIHDAPVPNGDTRADSPNHPIDQLHEQEQSPERKGLANDHKDKAVCSTDRPDWSAKYRDVHQRFSPADKQLVAGSESKHPLSPSRDHRGFSKNDHSLERHHSSESPAWPTHRRASASRPSTSPASSYQSPRLLSGEDRGSYFALAPHHHISTENRSPSGLPAGFSPVGAPHPRPATSGEASPSARSPYTSPDPTAPLRSPPFRRPPASRSAHGIETAFGPPPALSTQRSYSTDRWRRAVAAANSERGLGLLVPAGQVQAPKGQSPTSPTKEGADPLTFQALEQLDATAQASASESQLEDGENHGSVDSEDHKEEVFRVENSGGTPSGRQEKADDTNYVIPGDFEDSKMDAKTSQLPTASPQRRSLLGSVRPRSNSKRLSANPPAESAAQEGQSQSSHEDLFLDLAKGEDYRTPSNDDRRPSRIALPAHRPSVSHTGIGTEGGEVKSSPLAHIRRRSVQRATVDFPQSPVTPRNPSVKQRPYAASAHPLDSQRVPSRLTERTPQPTLTNVAHSKDERSPELPSRRQSVTENFSRPYRSSYLQHMTNGNSYSSPMPPRGQPDETERAPPPPRHEGTESTVSTTAPSTVWDELDDLKSRIRNLEVTGKLPSSGAAMSGNGRPQTATTTVTTVSSSPKRTRQHSLSPAEPHAEVEESLHPLLQSALAKAQGQLTTAAYRALEACANDALAIAQTSTSAQHQPVAQSTLERTLKRRADNLCRSMTELCIALAEPRGPFSPSERRGSSSRPASRSGTATLRRPDLTVDTETRYSRAQSLDPEPTSARVLSRLEARRSSLAGGRSGGDFLTSSRDTSHSRRTSPSREREANGPDPATATTPTQSTLGRYATVAQRRQLEGMDSDRTLRPLSRSRTDANSRSTFGIGASKRVSREYTSQYPLPSPSAAAPSEGRSPFTTPRERGEARRSYLNSTVSSTMRRAERDARSMSEARMAEEDDTLTMPTTPSTTIGPDDRRRSLAEARERERAREGHLRDQQDRLDERYGERSQERTRLAERDSERTIRHEVANGAAAVNGETLRPGGNSWQEKYATVREARQRDGRVEERPSGIAAPGGGSFTGSAALERAQKRLSGSYAGSRLSGRFTQGIRTVPREGA